MRPARRAFGKRVPPPKADGAFRAATLNVHYIWGRRATGPWSVGDWEARAPSLAAAVAATDADLIAFQEMETFSGGNSDETNLARDYLLERFPSYEAAAIGDWREFPSTQPIFYRPETLTLRDEGWFFFSDSPDEIYSRTFDGSYPAFASWAEFETPSGARFRAINVHLDAGSGENRLRSAELIADRIASFPEGVPALLLGDLNARAGSRTAGILENAGLTFAPVPGATFHFDHGINLFGAIDHIATGPGLRLAAGPVVLRERFEGDWPSDHYPVVADITARAAANR
ncbi:endonuclease/exonuclease/phosphatase family protein [Roseivivax halodurans]|uniref:endonuclease/exonuclease/phosphatase family protein n=1 Tax=Roseivivax halodurans TaxID=93683 RepID=UPI003137FC08